MFVLIAVSRDRLIAVSPPRFAVAWKANLYRCVGLAWWRLGLALAVIAIGVFKRNSGRGLLAPN
jgi:hypothetical protein